MSTISPSSRRTLIAVLILVGLSSLLAAGYLLAAQETFTVYDGQNPVMVSGSFATVGDVLAGADIDLRPEDVVIPDVGETAVPGQAIQIQRAQPVTLVTDAGTKIIWTVHPTLGAFLQEAGITAGSTDQIFADGRQIPFNQLDETPLPQKVEIGRFVTVTILENGQQNVVRTAVQTVGAALTEAGITIYAADSVTPPLGSWLEPGMTIQVQRSVPLTIQVDGRIIQTRSAHTNALGVLAEAGIGLVGYDYTDPGPETVLQPNDVIRVIRVTEDFRLEDQPIPYQTLYQASDELDLDTQAVISAGVPGILRQRIRVRYENGAEVSQTVDGEWTAREPVNAVIGYGTRINIRTIQTEQGPREYWRVVRMRVTSYTAASSGKSPDNPRYGITASGLPAGKGVVAVDRNIVPWKSQVFIPGYGVAIAGDTGGGVRGRWVDLGFDEDNFESWWGYRDVYFLTPVPAPEDINYLLPSVLP
ncbi:MAG: ubiquitin-like domain-containing protein [Anaerolineae bacterium]